MHFNYSGLGSATLLHLAFLAESDPNFPLEKFLLGQQSVKKKKKKKEEEEEEEEEEQEEQEINSKELFKLTILRGRRQLGNGELCAPEINHNWLAQGHP